MMITQERGRGAVAVLPMWWMACATAAVIVRLLSTGFLESGDGIQHYQIARYAWLHPELFLDHWGKPLFTLFASPFAQLGHWGMTLFNALCFVVTCWAADGVLNGAGRLARWLFAPALLFVPVYGTMVLAGMTEVFFGMLSMLVLRALFEKRYVLAVIISSFTPFARPEYIGFLPFVVAWIIAMRQWRSLPFLLTGHLVYALAGLLVLGDAFWFFHRDPYTGAEHIYGNGDPLYFMHHLQNIYGAPLVWCMAVAIACATVLWLRRKDQRATLRLLFVAGLLPCMAIIGIHSILWWQGLKGSLGLLRVVATTAPLAAAWVAWPIQVWASGFFAGKRLRGVVAVVFATAYIAWSMSAFLNERALPVEIDGYQRFVRSVGERVREISPQYARVVYYHPLVAYHAGLDPYDGERVVHCWGLDPALPALGLKPNDLLVWDAHCGPNEGGTPLNMLLVRTDLDLLEIMVPEERMTVLGGHPFEVYLFVQRDTQQRSSQVVLFDMGRPMDSTVAFRADTIPCGTTGPGWCFGGNEFPFEITELPLQRTGLFYGELMVSGEMELGENTDGFVDLVFTEETGTNKLSYSSEPVRNGHFEFSHRVPSRDPGVRNKLYVWDRSGKGLRIQDLRIVVVQRFYVE